MDANDKLLRLGWKSFFEKQVTEDEKNRYAAARVVAVHKYAFSLSDGSDFFAAVVSGKSLHAGEDHSDLPVVGDWVLARPPEGGTGVIVRRLERHSELSRRQPTDRNSHKISSERQVLAGNLDYVFIVMSLNQDLNPARLERALTIVWNGGATPVVLLSKADLCPDFEDKSRTIQAVAGGANVHVFSSLNVQGLQKIKDYFKSGVTGCLIGSSGAGKTTLLNALCGTQLKTLAVRQDDDKGRHATTSRALLFLPGGGMMIDTPGMREIGLMDDCSLSETFSDIAGLARGCKYSDCTHRVEPGCAVLSALNENGISQERYDHYLKLYRELEYQTGKYSTAKLREIKQRQKQFGKLKKDYYKINPK